MAIGLLSPGNDIGKLGGALTHPLPFSCLFYYFQVASRWLASAASVERFAKLYTRCIEALRGTGRVSFQPLLPPNFFPPQRKGTKVHRTVVAVSYEI